MIWPTNGDLGIAETESTDQPKQDEEGQEEVSSDSSDETSHSSEETSSGEPRVKKAKRSRLPSYRMNKERVATSTSHPSKIHLWGKCYVKNGKVDLKRDL